MESRSAISTRVIKTMGIRSMWRSIWFMDDDDKTPQGKLARGCFYLIYWAIGFVVLFGGIVPAIKYVWGG